MIEMVAMVEELLLMVL